MADKSLRWSERALKENRKLLDYLLSEWGEEITLRIKEQIDRSADRIHLSPEHFPVFLKSKNVRRCVVSPQTSIFFKVNRSEIVIVTLFDNRQSPKKRKL
jgi:plasmid stabilization system protein ParE